MTAVAATMAGEPLESRVARLESDVAHISSNIEEMKLDLREIRTELGSMDKRFSGKLSDLDRKLVHGLMSNRIWMLLQSAALLAVMARAFKWL